MGHAAQSTLNSLAKQEHWLSLVHYRDVGVFNEAWESEADDESFFLSPNGKYSPLDELKHTYQKRFVEKDIELICKYPARYTVIASYLGTRNLEDLSQCRELEEWKEKIPAVAAPLVFPAAYLDSPSSMFGHTF